MFSQAKLIGLGLGALAILAVVAAGSMHYKSILRDRDDAYAARDRLTIQVAEIEESRDLWRQNAESTARAMDALSKAATAANAEVERLNDLFAEHDLAALAKGRPGLIERRINDGTARILWVLESATAAGDGHR